MEETDEEYLEEIRNQSGAEQQKICPRQGGQTGMEQKICRICRLTESGYQ